MLGYIIRRLILIIPTLFGIMLINFAIVHVAPGGPVEQVIAEIKGTAVSATAKFAGDTSSETGNKMAAGAAPIGSIENKYRGSQGLDPNFIRQLEKQFGFDKPAHERFFLMMKNYMTFDFGKSYFRDQSVTALVIEKIPVSISLGLWSMLLIYLISVPLGVAKAVRDGSRFDVMTSTAVIIGNALPGFLFAILLVVLFAGGRYFDWFPLRGIVSSNWRELSTLALIGDYFWHMALPIISLVIGGFAGLTMLTKNSFLDQINQQYVVTARAKGLTEKKVLYGHVFRNAMLIVIAGFPSALIGILFTGSLLIEVIFSLDGLGLLGFEAAVNRDYPVLFGTLYFFTLIGLFLQLVSDLCYTIIDPRIDFDSRKI